MAKGSKPVHYERKNSGARIIFGLCGTAHNRKHSDPASRDVFGKATTVRKNVTCEVCLKMIDCGALDGVNIYKDKNGPYQVFIGCFIEACMEAWKTDEEKDGISDRR